MTNPGFAGIINLAFAGVAHLVERDLAKVEVASSSLVARSKKHHLRRWCFFFCAHRHAGPMIRDAIKCLEIAPGMRYTGGVSHGRINRV